MNFIGLRKDKETEEIIRYELNIYEEDISCLYKDRYGVYVCTKQGRVYKVESSIDDLQNKIGI